MRSARTAVVFLNRFPVYEHNIFQDDWRSKGSLNQIHPTEQYIYTDRIINTEINDLSNLGSFH